MPSTIVIELHPHMYLLANCKCCCALLMPLV